ncbi:hypothetical protein Q7P35_009072 [Cladosporium inversicolor]
MHRFLCYILRHPTFDSGGASKEIHAPTPYKPFDTSITNAHYAGSEGVILDGQMRHTNDTTDDSQRRDESIRDTPTTVVPLVARSTEKANVVAQRRNMTAQDPRKEAMPPSVHIVKEGKESSRGHNMRRSSDDDSIACDSKRP